MIATRDNNAMHAKSGLRVVLEWKIFRPDSVIADVIRLIRMQYLGTLFVDQPFDKALWQSLLETHAEFSSTNAIAVENPMTGDIVPIDDTQSFIASISSDGVNGAMRATKKFAGNLEFWGDSDLIELMKSLSEELGGHFELSEEFAESDPDGYVDVFQLFEEPTDEKLVDFVTNFKTQYDEDIGVAFEELAYWQGLSDDEKSVNMNAFTEDLFGKIETIKTLPFEKWDEPDEHQPYIEDDAYKTAMTPSHVLYFKSREKNMAVQCWCYLFDVDGNYLIGTARNAI